MSTGQIMGWGHKAIEIRAIEIRAVETGHLDVMTVDGRL